MWTLVKYLVLICTTLFLTPQGVNYAHNALPLDHNHHPYFVNEGDGNNFIQNVYVSENTSNYIIGNVKAVDEDEDDTLTYSLKSEYMYYSLNPDHRLSYSEFYTINSETGEVSIGSSKLDFEAFPLTYHPTHIYQPVPIKVEDGNGGSSIFTYQVYIKDENDNAPVFSADSQTLSVNENEPSDTTVGTVSASDADIFAGDHTYSIETENVPFTIENSKRSGTIKTTSVLDYEITNSYTLKVKVDDGFGTDTISVTINITNDTSDDPTPNSAPTFSDDSRTTRSIQENAASGVNIGLPVSATDDDSGDTLEYTLSGTDAASFSIHSTNGQLQTNAALDYETKKSYEVTVSVSDGNGGSDSITVTINITNDTSDDPTPVEQQIVVVPPTDPVSEQQVPETAQDDVTNSAPAFADGDSTTRSIQENTTAGTNIGLPVSATDDDSGDTLEYTLSGTDAASFSIHSTNGQLQTNAALDYETKKSYEVTVSVSDGKGGMDTITVTISITNDTSDDPLTQLETTVIPPTDPVSEQQVSETAQQDDLQQPQPAADPEPEQNYTITPFDYEKQDVGKVVFSELMLAHPEKYPQWIELYNTTDQDVDMNGWKIVGRYSDDSNTINILESQVISKPFTIKGKETGLIVSFATQNSRDRISNGLADKTYPLQSTPKNFWNYEGLVLELQDAEGNPIDRIGNLNEENEIVWEIPTVVREKRISLIRRLKPIRSQEYNFIFGVKEFGWFPAEEVERLIKNGSQYYYGRHTDIGSPGYRTENGEVLPVTLSSFRAQQNNNEKIILSWVTESELENAGFNILRSQSKQGPFIKVNPKLIQGAGTTSKRSSYAWMDTTAKPDVVYYYRIEDVSFSGYRNQLATVRTRGHISASDRYITQWGNLKKHHYVTVQKPPNTYKYIQNNSDK